MIKMFVMDVDGTLTDGKIYIGNYGECMKAFNVKDGYAVHTILKKYGIEPIIITGRNSEIVTRRSSELGVNYLWQGVTDKCQELMKQMHIIDKNLKCSDIAYIGDDVNDLEAMHMLKKKGGLIGCPSDAVDQVKQCAHFICKKRGGEGAVREFIEWIIERENSRD
mgnify:CR=1 FL=1